ncbi:hypothetical protein SAMN02745207_02936 [Clostridium grantii DSM 8605]|uniref:Uncharacterized protein n=2 Tax=Clostridium TaxID=1485 RepID=A0A1M5WJE4_9CLOT|nr:hypothetical protein SAMN02745207_02936 [Clostridium grantii DSM 8605]
MMTEYSSKHQKINTNSVSVPHYHEIDNTSATGLNYELNNLSGYTGYIPNLHSVADGYDKNEKIKDILKSENLF